MRLNNKTLIIVLIILISLTLLTRYYGSTDIGDYADSAKYFAGDYAAKTRSSHSFLYGLIASPFVALVHSLIIFKIYSLVFLFLIIYSVYIISGKEKKSFWLMLLSPAVWYMAPWISPLQLSSLLLLWAYFFMSKYHKTTALKNLFFSGLLLGLAWAFWNTIIYFALALIIAFMYDKKFSHFALVILSIAIGAIPLFLLDQFLFGFPFYTILKTTFGQYLFVFAGKGIYGAARDSGRLLSTVLILLSFPMYFWINYKPYFFKTSKRTMIFLSLSVLIILLNPQIRYVIAIVPIMTLLLVKNLDENQFRKQLAVSVIVLLIFIVPYIIQIKYNINNEPEGMEITGILSNCNNLSLSNIFYSDLIKMDIKEISKEFPQETFVVGNNPDSYQLLADLYWGKDVKEFVSIQDYNLVMENKTELFSVKFMPVPRINDRRQIWITAGMNKNTNDKTDYYSIRYALAFEENLQLKDFALIKQYRTLGLYQRL